MIFRFNPYVFDFVKTESATPRGLRFFYWANVNQGYLLSRGTFMIAENRAVRLFMLTSLFAGVVRVGDLFQPFNVLAVDCSRDGDMRHGGGG